MVNNDCNDNNPCTVDICSLGSCSNTPVHICSILCIVGTWFQLYFVFVRRHEKRAGQFWSSVSQCSWFKLFCFVRFANNSLFGLLMRMLCLCRIVGPCDRNDVCDGVSCK